jgi:hypothetical protein
LKPNLYWQASSLIDPVTGMTRRISGQSNRRLSFEFTQDLKDWKSTWGFGLLPASWGWSNWRIAQISHVGLHTPYSWIYWTYNPAADWSVKVEVDNATPYRFELRQDLYSGPRDVSPLASVQDVFTRTRPKLFLQLRKTF